MADSIHLEPPYDRGHQWHLVFGAERAVVSRSTAVLLNKRLGIRIDGLNLSSVRLHPDLAAEPLTMSKKAERLLGQAGIDWRHAEEQPTCPECLYELRTGEVAPSDHSCETEGNQYRRLGEHEPNRRRTAKEEREFQARQQLLYRPGWTMPTKRYTSFGEITSRVNLETGDEEGEVSGGGFSGGYATFVAPGGHDVEGHARRALEAAQQRPNRSGYYVWPLARGSNEPLAGEGPWGPYPHLDTAKTFARIGATEGKHDRAVSFGADPSASGFSVLRRYAAGTGERVL